jgi:hypothetical protein
VLDAAHGYSSATIARRPLFDIADQLGGDLLDLCRARAPRDEPFAALLRAGGMI